MSSFLVFVLFCFLPQVHVAIFQELKLTSGSIKKRYVEQNNGNIISNNTHKYCPTCVNSANSAFELISHLGIHNTKSFAMQLWSSGLIDKLLQKEVFFVVVFLTMI